MMNQIATFCQTDRIQSFDQSTVAGRIDYLGTSPRLIASSAIRSAHAQFPY